MENQELMDENKISPIDIIEKAPEVSTDPIQPTELNESLKNDEKLSEHNDDLNENKIVKMNDLETENQELVNENKSSPIAIIEKSPEEEMDPIQPTKLNESLKNDEKLSEHNYDINENKTTEMNDLEETEISARNYSKEERVIILSDGFARENEFFQTNNQLSFREEVKLEYFCEKCSRILWNPIKLKCGHIICYTCQPFPDSFQNDVLNCPIDEETTKEDEIEQCENYKDNIWNLQIYCSTILCDWFGILSNFRSHFETCELKQIKCPQCDEMIQWGNFEAHKLNTCEMRSVLCQFCSNPIFSKDAKSHENVCDDKLIECPNSCKFPTDKTKAMILKQGILKFHLENACSERKVPCPFEMFGCKNKSKQKKMHHHLTKYAIIHLEMICSFGRKNTESLEKQVRSMLELKDKLERSDGKIKILNSEFGTQLLWKIDNINEKYQAALVGANEEIVSNPFYSTAPYGYRFIMRLVFNVHNVKLSSQYLSIFISICDSPFNVLLPWPFKLKLNIHLVNQISEKHISHCFLPNTIVENYPFINRPKTQRNPYFGIEKFANCNIFHDNSPFVAGNAMFIKILIEPHEIV